MSPPAGLFHIRGPGLNGLVGPRAPGEQDASGNGDVVYLVGDNLLDACFRALAQAPAGVSILLAGLGDMAELAGRWPDDPGTGWLVARQTTALALQNAYNAADAANVELRVLVAPNVDVINQLSVAWEER